MKCQLRALFSTIATMALMISTFTNAGATLPLMKNAKRQVQATRKDPDVGKDMIEISQTRGYHIETHYVTTADGYVLTIFNIPHGKNGSGRNSKPVLLQHGLLDSSYTWVNNYEDQSLGFILAENGFDVWFGNNRGNRYGRNHTTLDPDGESALEFWTFSWDEMASFDAPAMINYVTKVTNTSSLGWVGHSEGTIQMFAAGTIMEQNSLVKEALSKVNLFVALAPVAYVHNVGAVPLQALAQTDILQQELEQGIYEEFPYGTVTAVAPTLCQADPSGCNSFFAILMGPTENLNETRLQVYVSETPAGTSVINLDHWAQGVLIDTFQMYDYRSEETNKAHYGQSTPPLYDLSKFGLKVAIFSGSNDYLADPTDVQRLLKELPASSIIYNNNQDDYAHCDFVWAPNASQRIYPKVLELLNQYAN